MPNFIFSNSSDRLKVRSRVQLDVYQVRVEAGRSMTEDAMRKGQQSSNKGGVRASAVRPSRHFRRQPVIGIALLRLYGSRYWHVE